MHDGPRTRRRRSGGPLLVLLALGGALAACTPSPPAADSPAGVVRQALDRTAAKDLDGLRSLACAGQEDLVRTQLGLPGTGGGELLPGLDIDSLLDAVAFDVTGVEIGDAAVTGDVALVPVTGSVKATFDAAAMRPVVKRLLAQQGRDLTDQQLDALLKQLQAFGQDIPVDDRVRLVREGGAWKVCQDRVPGAPSP